MSYNRTIFNTPTIYIDIQADFDRTLDVLIIIGQINKISRLEELKRQEQIYNNFLKGITKKQAKKMYDLDTQYDEMSKYASILIKKNKNIILRTPSGRFSSTHKEINKILQEGFDSNYNYQAVRGIYNKMNNKQKIRYLSSIEQFVKSLVKMEMFTEEINRAEQGYRTISEKYIRSSKHLDKAKDELAKARTQLKKLGFVAIIKMIDDIEKKARRYKL